MEAEISIRKGSKQQTAGAESPDLAGDDLPAKGEAGVQCGWHGMPGHHQSPNGYEVEWSPNAFQIAPNLRQVIWLMVDNLNALGWAARQEQGKDQLEEAMKAEHTTKLYALLMIPSVSMHQEAVVTLMGISVMLNAGF